MNAFEAVWCIVTPAAGIGVAEVDPTGAGLFQDALDFVKDIAKMFDVEVECWFQAKLPFPGGTLFTETGWLPLVSVPDGG